MPPHKALFTAETLRFFRELGRNNRKEWMDENRGRYQEHIVQPFRALLEELTPAVHKLDAGFDVSGRTGTNFSRINRDIRFAKDKSPYRTQMYLMFPGPGGKGWQGGQLYVGISTDTVTAGFRIYSDYKLHGRACSRTRGGFRGRSAASRRSMKATGIPARSASGPSTPGGPPPRRNGRSCSAGSSAGK